MKKSILLVAVIMVLFMFFSSCKTAEFIWNPVGVWMLTITGDWGTWTETLTFAGSETTGTVSGWLLFNPSLTLGTWTKIGFTLTINLDFYNVPYHNVITFTGTSSEANPNSMTGNATWIEYWNSTYNDTYSMTFTGIKTTNLQ